MRLSCFSPIFHQIGAVARASCACSTALHLLTRPGHLSRKLHHKSTNLRFILDHHSPPSTTNPWSHLLPSPSPKSSTLHKDSSQPKLSRHSRFSPPAMSSSASDDDVPLAKANGHGALSSAKITKAVDRALDRSVDKKLSTSDRAQAGLSIRNGPIQDAMEIDPPSNSGVAKRKSRASISNGVNYKDTSDSDGEPLAKRVKTSESAPDSDSDAPIVQKRKSKVLPPSYKETAMLDESDDDVPLGIKLADKKREIEADAVVEARAIRAAEAKQNKEVDVKRKSKSSNSEPVNSKVKKANGVKLEESDSDAPVAKKLKTASATAVKTANPKTEAGSDSDVPIGRRKTAKAAAKVKKEESDSDVPIAQKSKAKALGKVKKEESDSDVPISKKKTSAKPAASKSAPAKGAGATSKTAAAKEKATGKAKTPAKGKSSKEKSEEPAEEDDEAEDENAWWVEGPNDDDSVKWTTLEHNGVLFPPAYEPLPKHVKLVYDGVEVDLHPEAEEVAGFYGSMLKSEHCSKPVFNNNFFGDFQEVIKATGGAKNAKTGAKIDIKSFDKLNFENIYQYYFEKNEAKKARPAAEKKADKAAKEAFEAPFMYCKWDGRTEKVGNFRVEPPSLFRGRGDHPKTGKLKKRVMPEQVTINIGKDAVVPKPPEGHKWKAVQHDNTCTWLATWKENVNNNTKYVMLAANSTIKGMSDWKKFEKARSLKKYIDQIRADYTRDLKSELMANRQRATAVYFIDKFALRAGNEKDTENEAETVGCCSLKYEHVTLKEPNTVVFDFLGKDSIPFKAEFVVEPQVFKNLRLFKKEPKTKGDDLFDRLNTTQLNKHLSSYMKGLSAKVFRTYNASWTMAKLLRELVIPEKATVQEKVKLFNDCNREVAVLCNHKRSVGASHEVAMTKLNERCKAVEYQKWRLKQMILELDPKQKKKMGADYFKLPDDINQEWVLTHQRALVEDTRSKIEKKFQKENEKLAEEGKKPQPNKELKERLTVATELEAKFKKENKTKKVEPEGRGVTVEKLLNQIERKDNQLRLLQIQASDRDGNKEVALGTSKINYIDPRLTVVFSKQAGIPIEKLFSKTLRDKFTWAIKSVESEEDWQF